MSSEKFLGNLCYGFKNIHKIKHSTLRALHSKFCEFVSNCNATLKSNEMETLAKYCIQYIEYIHTYLTQESLTLTPIKRIKDIVSYVSVLEHIAALPGARETFFRFIIKPLLEKVVDPETNHCIAKELLKQFNLVVRGTKIPERFLFIEENKVILCKLVDLLSCSGDYEFQFCILETIFRICSPEQIKDNALLLFPESSEFVERFLLIQYNSFENDVRYLLNSINYKFKNIVSVKCENVLLGDIIVTGPKDTFSETLPLWIDFNIKVKTITILCDRNSLRTLPFTNEEENETDKREILLIAIDDVSTININRYFEPKHDKPMGTLIHLLLNKKCSVIYKSSMYAAKAQKVMLKIPNCKELIELERNVFPELFKDRLQIAKSTMGEMRTGGMNGERSLLQPITRASITSCRGSSDISSTSDAMSLRERMQELDYEVETKTFRKIVVEPCFRSVDELKKKCSTLQTAKNKTVTKQPSNNGSLVHEPVSDISNVTLNSTKSLGLTEVLDYGTSGLEVESDISTNELSNDSLNCDDGETNNELISSIMNSHILNVVEPNNVRVNVAGLESTNLSYCSDMDIMNVGGPNSERVDISRLGITNLSFFADTDLSDDENSSSDTNTEKATAVSVKSINDTLMNNEIIENVHTDNRHNEVQKLVDEIIDISQDDSILSGESFTENTNVSKNVASVNLLEDKYDKLSTPTHIDSNENCYISSERLALEDIDDDIFERSTILNICVKRVGEISRFSVASTRGIKNVSNNENNNQSKEMKQISPQVLNNVNEIGTIIIDNDRRSSRSNSNSMPRQASHLSIAVASKNAYKYPIKNCIPDITLPVVTKASQPLLDIDGIRYTEPSNSKIKFKKARKNTWYKKKPDKTIQEIESSNIQETTKITPEKKMPKIALGQKIPKVIMKNNESKINAGSQNNIDQQRQKTPDINFVQETLNITEQETPRVIKENAELKIKAGYKNITDKQIQKTPEISFVQETQEFTEQRTPNVNMKKDNLLNARFLLKQLVVNVTRLSNDTINKAICRSTSNNVINDQEQSKEITNDLSNNNNSNDCCTSSLNKEPRQFLKNALLNDNVTNLLQQVDINANEEGSKINEVYEGNPEIQELRKNHKSKDTLELSSQKENVVLGNVINTEKQNLVLLKVIEPTPLLSKTPPEHAIINNGTPVLKNATKRHIRNKNVKNDSEKCGFKEMENHTVRQFPQLNPKYLSYLEETCTNGLSDKSFGKTSPTLYKDTDTISENLTVGQEKLSHLNASMQELQQTSKSIDIDDIKNRAFDSLINQSKDLDKNYNSHRDISQSKAQHNNKHTYKSKESIHKKSFKPDRSKSKNMSLDTWNKLGTNQTSSTTLFHRQKLKSFLDYMAMNNKSSAKHDKQSHYRTSSNEVARAHTYVESTKRKRTSQKVKSKSSEYLNKSKIRKLKSKMPELNVKIHQGKTSSKKDTCSDSRTGSDSYFANNQLNVINKTSKVNILSEVVVKRPVSNIGVQSSLLLIPDLDNGSHVVVKSPAGNIGIQSPLPLIPDLDNGSSLNDLMNGLSQESEQTIKGCIDKLVLVNLKTIKAMLQFHEQNCNNPDDVDYQRRFKLLNEVIKMLESY